MKQGSGLPDWMRNAGSVGCLVLLAGLCSWSQQSNPPATSSPVDSTAAAIRELQQQVNELRSAMVEMRAETNQYRAENAALRHELQVERSSSASLAESRPGDSYAAGSPARTDQETVPAQSVAPAATSHSLEERVGALEELSQLVNSKVDDQYQTKVESASKYRVRLSGIALLNLFNTHGQVDNQDFPSLVRGSSAGTGSFGASLRQSQIGLEVFGPTVFGAKTTASLQADFSGGFTETWNGVNSGIFRLRTASMRLDWKNTSVVAGQDSFFAAPLSPTSFASLAVPALNYAGNLWAWTPQLRLEHRFDISNAQAITIQGGILDNLIGDFPPNGYFREANPGELSRQPAFALRTAWTHSLRGQPLTFGAAGYYSRQDWPNDHYVDGWSGMADWEIPVLSRLLFSGEFYRGRAIAGIGGNISQDVLYRGDPANPATALHGLDSIGGWSQLKFKVTPTLELNAAYGLDNPYGTELRAAAPSQQYLFIPLWTQNRGTLVNFVLRPRSSLLFSGEYRHLRTSQLNDISNSADQFNLIMGILF